MQYLIYFTKDIEDYLIVKSQYTEFHNILHFHRKSDSTPLYKCSKEINASVNRSFMDEFHYCLNYLTKFNDKDRIIFLGAGDMASVSSQTLNPEVIYRNRVIDSSLLNRIFSFFFIRFNSKLILNNNLQNEFDQIGFLIGYLGTYNYSIKQINSALETNFSPTSLWFIAEFLNHLINSGFYIKSGYHRIVKMRGEDKTIGSESKNKDLERLFICKVLIKLLNLKFTPLGRLQYYKFKLRIFFKWVLYEL